MRFICDHRSPNFSERKHEIDTIVIHSTELPLQQSLNMLLGETEREVSCHYLIDQQGITYELVVPEKIAWHAGESYWRGREKINQYSIGIEIVDVDDKGGYVGFSNRQTLSVISLCKYLLSLYPIDQRNIVAHSDIAPARKKDPGENFPWGQLNEEGVGLFYRPDSITQDAVIKCKEGDHNDHVYLARRLLSEIGYGVELSDVYNQELSKVVQAFKRRFYQKDMHNNLNGEAFQILNILAKKFSSADN